VDHRAIEAMFRVAKQRIQLGQWVVPEGCGVMPSIALIHNSRCHFAEPQRFEPDRFLGGNPDSDTGSLTVGASGAATGRAQISPVALARS
jgi:cytochrome P450